MMAGRRLLILEGVHAGAELFLANGSYMIGADLDCEMVLLDAGIDRQHLRLSVENDRVNIERLGDAQVMLHGRAVEGKSFIMLDGDVVRLGDAAFSVARVAAEPAETAPDARQGAQLPTAADIVPQAIRPPRRRLARILVPLTMLVALVGGGASLRVLGRDAAALEPVPLPPAPRHAVTAPGHADLVPRVREFIADDTLDVRLDGPGRIIVSGTTKKELVQKQLQQIAKEYAGAIEILDQVSYVLEERKQNKLPLPQRITGVSIGRTSWFQTADGAKNFEGSKLADGAEVIRIGMDGIVFRRDGKLTVFPLNDKEIE